MEDVETFEAGNEGTCGTLAERIGKGTGEAGVPYEVIAVHRCVTIAATRVHLQVGSKAEAL